MGCFNPSTPSIYTTNGYKDRREKILFPYNMTDVGSLIIVYIGTLKKTGGLPSQSKDCKRTGRTDRPYVCVVSVVYSLPTGTLSESVNRLKRTRSLFETVKCCLNKRRYRTGSERVVMSQVVRDGIVRRNPGIRTGVITGK